MVKQKHYLLVVYNTITLITDRGLQVQGVRSVLMLAFYYKYKLDL